MCKKVHLTTDDLEQMTVGNCLDYVDEYIDQMKPENEKTRNATQEDYDNF